MKCCAPATASLPGAACSGRGCVSALNARAGYRPRAGTPSNARSSSRRAAICWSCPTPTRASLIMDILRHVPAVEVLGPVGSRDEVLRKLRLALQKFGCRVTP